MRTFLRTACLALAAMACLRGCQYWKRPPKLSGASRPTTTSVQFSGVMGTDVDLLAISPSDGAGRNSRAVAAAERVLRDVEAKMSSRLEASELSRFNAAGKAIECPLSAETLGVLRAARRYAELTDGAFDVTCRPLLELWSQAGKAGRAPTDEEIAAARARVGWDKVRLTASGAMKTADGVSIDLGGIAKKYAIDRAAEAMMAEGLSGGFVNVGGDIRVFGRRAEGGPWRVGVKDPFHPTEKPLLVLAVEGGAVCTSGNYERFVTIDGRRYSHIVDPRTGRTADAVPSVTVVGPTTVEAGVWATALSVLGPDGLKLLPQRAATQPVQDTTTQRAQDTATRPPQGAAIEAMLITGTPDDYKMTMTDGFSRLIAADISGPPSSAPATPEPAASGAMLPRAAGKHSRAIANARVR